MKKLITALILLLSPTMAFAFSSTTPCTLEEGGKCAAYYLKAGETLANTTIDATGFMHGIEMNVVGTAYLMNVVIENAGTPGFVQGDGRGRGNGRGLVVTGAGAKVIVVGGSANNNTEDGYRVINGGILEITNASANNNRKIGFFGGANSILEIYNGSASGNEYGVLGADFTEITVHDGKYEENIFQGMQMWDGGIFKVDGAIIINNGGGINSPEFPWSGMGIYGVPEVRVTNTDITGNNGAALFVESDSTKNQRESRVRLDNVTITNNSSVDYSDSGIMSSGDSVVEIFNSRLTGTCQSVTGADGTIGIIRVEDQQLEADVPCP